MTVKQLDVDSFDETIKEGVTLVDFWAPWCMPCKAMLPILEDVATQTKDWGDVTIGKVNVDECPELAGRFSISSIPALIIFKDGEPVSSKVGVQPGRVLVDALASQRGA